MPLFSVRFSDKALRDLQHAIYWYELQKRGLGNRFFNAVQRRIEYLKKYPESGSVRYKDIRCVLVKKFPCLLHYLINYENETIYIVSVKHTSQNPENWKG